MNCPTCGKPIHGRALFCPSCGQKVAMRPAARPMEAPRGALGAPAGERSEGCRQTVTVLVLSGVAFLLVIGLAVGGVALGLRDRQEAVRQAALEHYARGSDHLAQHEYELAAAEFGMALQLDPGLEEARQGLDVAQGRLEGLP